MTQRGFSDYAALWREQIDPKELAEHRAMAAGIKRAAGWRWRLDRVLALVAIAMVSTAIVTAPATLPVKLGFALLLPPTVWLLWKRYRITRASRSIALDDPGRFFEAAIDNVRAEISLSTLSTALGLPAFIFCCLLAGASFGFERVYRGLWDIVTLASFRPAAIAVVMLLAAIYFVRDNLRLRAQLRRLRAMRREWEEREAGEEP